MLYKYHYKAPDFTVQTNLEVLTLFLEKLDPNRIYFYQSELQQFKKIIADTPDENAFCLLFGVIEPLYKKHLQIHDSIMTQLSNQNVTYNPKDSVYYNRISKPDFPADIMDVRQRLEKHVKASVLANILKPKTEKEDPASISLEKFKQLEPEERKHVIARERKKYQLILSDESRLKEFVFEQLNDAICKRCDPHSDYFNLREKESFEGSLSSEHMSFGFSVADSKEDEIIIAHLVPGSPAWKCNALHEGDVLVRIKWPGKESIDLSNSDAEAFYDLMEKNNSSKIQLTIRQKNNTIQSVNLEKEKVSSEENTLNSFVLTDENIKIGYIPLPSFYTDFDEQTGLGCANDVAKEILKLKAENIQGLILDLRYNGGGSMKEAMDLAGIFIDEGPLAILRGKKDKPGALKDLNRGTLYDGPLLVLINNYSASASEFFSAAVQDYHRAILVGSNSYGKATAQGIIPADTNIYFYKNKHNITCGYVKLTAHKFYRITGVSHQAIGIKPDIYLPDLLDKISVTESQMPFALLPDAITKKFAYKPYPELPLELLREKSRLRTQQNTGFESVLNLQPEVENAWKKEYKTALTLESFRKHMIWLNSIQNQIQALGKDSLGKNLQVESNNYAKGLMNFSTYKKEENERLIEELSQDIYLKEAFLILKDLNIFNQK